jgi:hypothetical protein
MTCAKHPSLLRSSSRPLPRTQGDRRSSFRLLRRPFGFSCPPVVSNISDYVRLWPLSEVFPNHAALEEIHLDDKTRLPGTEKRLLD